MQKLSLLNKPPCGGVSETDGECLSHRLGQGECSVCLTGSNLVVFLAITHNQTLMASPHH